MGNIFKLNLVFLKMVEDKKPKIKLVMPPRSFLEEGPGLISIPPLGIANLSSFLKREGYQVELDDLDIKVISDKKLFDRLLTLQKKYNKQDLNDYLLNNVSNSYLDEITKLLLQKMDYKEKDVVGFSLIESSAVDFALLISKRIKEETGAKIIFGGTCADPSLKKTYKFIDYVVCGAGEIETLKILCELENKSLRSSIPPIFPKPFPDFSSLPLFCYKNMPEGSQFSNIGKILILPYIWSWGCPYNCSFCGNSLNKARIFLRPVEETIKDLKKLSSEYTNYFFILNEYVHTDREYTEKLCQEICNKKMDIVWCGSARCNLDNTLLPKLRKAGCCYLFFGLESGSDNILKKMRKGYNREIAEQTIRAASKAGLWVNISIIVGFPTEKEEDFNQTLDFVNRNQQYIDQIAVSPFYLVNSAITLEPEKFGIRILRDAGVDKNSAREKFSYDEINGPSWKEVEETKGRRLQKLFKLFYLHKSIREGALRSSTYDVLYAFDRFKHKKKVLEFIRNKYYERKRREEPIINIISLCNNNCLFCKKPKEVVNSLGDISTKLRELRKSNIRRIIISGGEPTIEPSFFKIIKLVKDEGFDVTVNTNARMLSNPLFCRRLYSMGVRTISVPIYSKRQEIHDRITKVEGSLRQALQGISNWKELGGDVEIRTVLFEENKKDISEFIDFILDLETAPVF